MTLSRRKLLLVGGGVVCAHAIGCGGGGAPIVLPKEIPAGNSSDLTAGSIRVVSASPVAVARDSGGIYALSLVCTHEGCDIRGSNGFINFNTIHCGCHGSEFNGQGSVLVGPATRPLPHLLVTADAAGALTVHGDTEVPATMRLT
jgi:Rieske Fe-S protein